jgi:glycerol-3-phosphate dehydrogenase
LPGGDLGEVSLPGFVQRLCRTRPAFDPEYLDRLARCYGTRVDNVLGDARRESDLGAALGGGLTEREVCYLNQHEWASEPDDVLWRRTKCGLHMTVDERRLAAEKIAKFL